MKCGMCHREIPEELPEEAVRCGSCRGGCKKVHCPFCGYGNPVLPNYLKKLTSSNNDDGRK